MMGDRARRLPTLGGEEVAPRAQTVWALVSVVVLALAFGAVAALYTHPPGSHTHRMLLPETGGLGVGDGVRIAGVPVGRVTAVRLGEGQVEVSFTVDADRHLGDRTAADIRMLTPVGGLYVALLPAGDAPLREPIPAARSRLPFVVGDLVEQGAAVADEVDTQALRTTLDAAARAVTGAPGAVREAVSALGQVVGALAEQRDQVQGLLELSNEYLATARANEVLAAEVIRAYAVLGPQIVAARTEVQIFADKMTAVVGLLFDFLAGPYAESLEPLFFPLEQSADLGRELLATIDGVLAELRGTLEQLAALAGPQGRALIDQSGLTVHRPDVCLPVPGAGC
ncbi:MCE family protein [Nocardia farcinica]|uniref:MlaD family protein n=2 Tax=Nocardiaceae TaxID=85025 RepID=UPI000BF0BBF8|nr:MlaD family protein [Nocardia elegans]MBF6183981.1 MCE family protein [Nocardia farcinica]PEH75913.1 mammalian cell entry protein [Nocardia sp. FDAARGOS_372]MBF6248603.1 MCE family protein [Nocardia elegans]MBF6260592.1 MCE family protein [Nocardia farcinica]MBF6279738.1 MCE family protein [Nocardia farcinica]